MIARKRKEKTKNYTHTMFLRLTEEEFAYTKLIKDKETRTKRNFIIEAIKEKINREKIL